MWREVGLKRLQRLSGGITQGSIEGKPRCADVSRASKGGHPQAAAVGQVGTNLVGVKRDVAEEVSVNEED